MQNLLKTVVLLVLFVVSPVRAENVIIPLSLDNALLTTLLRQSAFTEVDRSATIVGSPGDCTYLRVSEPKFSSIGGLLRLEIRLLIRLGGEFGENCLVPVEWEGYLQLFQKPLIDKTTFKLSLQTVDSKLLTLSRKPAFIAGFLWKFAQPRVYKHLNQVRIDLAPPVNDLRSFLKPLFSSRASQVVETMLESLRTGKILVQQNGVVVELLLDVENVYDPSEKQHNFALTVRERELLVRTWESWDALLVELVAALAASPLTPEDHQTLIDVLLDTRHVFSSVLEDQQLDKDFVRTQFVRVWQRLAPIFRRQLYARPADNSLGYLSFFTAADALAALDRMGPTFGVEISQRGLQRLAAMLSGKKEDLPYAKGVDGRLRKLLQLPAVNENDSMQNIEEIDLPADKAVLQPLSWLGDFFAGPVYASAMPTFSEILQWRVPDKDIDTYVKKVRKVLAEAALVVVAKGEIPKSWHPMFETLVPAMAWQESCFRQFVTRKKKLTYLLSYNHTSVGVMQINERVWRGIYNRDRLRWDIRYNALAGCEIVDLYLRRYALKGDLARRYSDDTDLLARVVYAMYNGGPSQLGKFMKRERSKKYYKSDLLFAEKLSWVQQRDWKQISSCFVGG